MTERNEVRIRVAAFDFDGTLARGDSLLAFMLMLIGPVRLAHSLIVHAPALIKIGLGRGDRDRTKKRFLAHALSGQSAMHVHNVGRMYAKELIGRRLFPSVMEKVRWHSDVGHTLILVSATLNVYLRPLVEELGFDELLCTQLEIEDDTVTGRLTGNNVRAAEKVRVIDEWLGDRKVELWAYGNSASDYELLSVADHPFWVKKDGAVIPWTGGAPK